AEGTHQNGELANKAVQTGQAHAAQGDDKAQATEYRQHLPDTAISGDVFGMTTFVQHTDQQEQAACADTVINHLQDRTLNADAVESKDTQDDETHMAHGRISD